MIWTYVDLQGWIAEGCDEEKGNQVLELIIFQENIREIPIETFLLVNLRVLRIGVSSVRKISPKIGKLIKLEVFDIHASDVRELPPEIGLLVNLERLVCSYNHLRKIPSEIKYLTKFCDFNKTSF